MNIVSHPKNRRFAFLVALLGLLVTLPVVAQEGEAAPAPEDDSKILYAMGIALGQRLSGMGLSEEEVESIKRGLADVALGKDTNINLQEYGPKIQGFVQKKMAAAAATEKAAAETFLDKMAGEAGAQRLDSGLIIVHTTEGTGASPTATDKVTVHYHGTLRDGSVFDSSVDRGEPATFGLNQVVPCWTEGLQLMKVGGKAKLTCPSSIAYGDQGRPGIPPGAPLVFEVELISIGGES